MGISELSLDKLRNNPNVKSIKKAYALNGGVLENDSLVKGLRDFSVFPQNNNFNLNFFLNEQCLLQRAAS